MVRTTAHTIQIFLIVLLSVIIYGPSLQNGFIWDDDLYVHKNPLIQKADGLKEIWFAHKTPQYYPLVFTTFWIEHKLWGVQPFGYHLVNLILHILNALLIFWIVRKLYTRVAFPVALLFAIYPIQVETVAWITERKNLLALFFFLLTMLAYLRFDRTRKRKHYLQSIGLFICALLSKSISVCFVSVPILHKWWRDGKVTWREVKLSIPFASIGLLSAINTMYVEIYRAGARGEEWSLAVLERFVLSGRTLLFYIYKLCIPLKFMFIYPRWTVDATQWWQWLFPLVSILLLLLLAYYRHQIGRGAVTLFIFYAISIFPALGFINFYPMRFSFVADHFSYFSTPVLFLLLCASIYFLLDKLKKRLPSLASVQSKTFMWSLLVIITVYMCGKSMTLTQSYKNGITLWEDVIHKNPKAWIAYNNLGNAYSDTGRKEEAISLFKKAIEIKPDCAKAYNNLGNAYKDIGEYERAIDMYKRAIKIRPNFAENYYNLGNTYVDVGKYKEAIAAYKKAIEVKSDFAVGYNNLGNIYVKIEKHKEAINSYKKAIEIDSNYVDAYNNLGVTYNAIGSYKEAKDACKRAIAIRPDYVAAYNTLGSAYNFVDEKEQAIAFYKKAVEINHNYAEAHSNLAITYYQKEEYALAIKHCDKALELGYKIDPKFLTLLKPHRKTNRPGS